MMRALITAFLLALATAAPAAADQADPRLDQLFAVLHTTQSTTRARQAEQAIWAVWIDHDDDRRQQVMTRGIAAMNSQRLADALAIFDELVELAPDYAEAWNKRATIYFLMGDFDASIADIDRTLDLEPRHFGALSGLGQIRIAQRDPAGALRAFEDALLVNPHMTGTRGLVEALRERLQGNEL